jgi:hypothetical protein
MRRTGIFGAAAGGGTTAAPQEAAGVSIPATLELNKMLVFGFIG